MTRGGGGGSTAATLEAAQRTVFVRNLVVPWSIGVYAHERGRSQRVRVNVDLSIDTDVAPRDDDIRNVVSYESVVDGIKAMAGDGHTNLVESVAERIGALCLTDHRVRAARIRVEKLDVYEEAESVGIEVEYRREAP